MRAIYEPLLGALKRMLDAIDSSIRSGGYAGEPIDMILAGGLAVHYYCGARFTQDVDASFSRRILLPVSDLVFEYVAPDGALTTLHLDGQYNTTYAVLHEDHDTGAEEWMGIGNEGRLVRLRVMSAVDLAVSKLARFAQHDQEDILALAEAGLFTAPELRVRAEEALSDYVGNTSSAKNSLQIICDRMDKIAREKHGSER